jgi:protein-disulfide isomerase
MSNGNNNSKAPLIIIGVVLIAVIAGVWWLMNRNTQGKPASNVNKPVSAKTPTVTNVLGAQPPNMLGSPNATVTVEEFADFQCPTCGVMHPKMKELISIYGSRIKFVFRNYPLAIPAHDKAYEAAVAAEAAGLQGRFWDMQNLLFTNQQAWSSNPDYRKVWEDYASRIGLDVERFKTDMAGLVAKERVNADMQRARALNINSTPSIFINGVAIPYEQMTVETMRQVIDAELAKANNQQSPTTSGGAPTNPAASEQSTGKK